MLGGGGGGVVPNFEHNPKFFFGEFLVTPPLTRLMLKDKNSSEPVFYGHKFKVIVKQGYFSGGAGYVLSKEALTR